MNDDLAQILRSIKDTQQNILDRLQSVERAVQLAGSTELPSPASWGYTSPTTPPSKKVAIRGGLGWFSQISVTDSMRCQAWPDFITTPSISAFTTAYYYRWAILFLSLRFYYDDPDTAMVDLWEGGTEYPTYEECATDMSSEFILTFSKAEYGPLVPLCVLAIRNDGTTGVANSYLPITLSDRSQSSYIMRDVRPWFYLVYDF